MANFVITGKAEQTDESSYTVQSTGEVVTKIQLTLNVPGMQDRVLCEMPLDVSPKPDILERWEMEESWLVVSANTMRALGFTRSNARPGEKAVGALVIFQATERRVHCPEWLGARVCPQGAKCGYAFLIETEGFSVRLLGERIKNRPSVYIEMRSYALHTHPQRPQGACRAALAWVREKLYADQPSNL